MENQPNRPAGIPASMRPGAPRPQPAHQQSTPHHHAPTPPPPPAQPSSMPMPPKPHKKPGMIVGLIALVAIALVITTAGIMMLVQNISATTAVKSNGFQAVFLTNNMVYFGKLTDVNSEYVKMSNIFYLQVQGQNGQAQKTDSTAQQQLSLTKLGGELHGPEDVMYINKKEILFWENLKADGKVTQAINDYLSKNK